MSEKPFDIELYETSSGSAPVREFLRALPKDPRTKCGKYIQLLEWRGLALPASYIKKVAGEIWELRPEYNGVEYRLFFGCEGATFVFVHAIVKKRQQTARADIEIAQRRYRDC